MDNEEVTYGHPIDNEHPVAGSGHPPAADSAAGSGTHPLNTFDSQYERLKAIQAEYRMTIRVVAVLAEQLLNLNSAVKKESLVEIAISDEALLDCPELVAWRDEENSQIVIKIKR